MDYVTFCCMEAPWGALSLREGANSTCESKIDTDIPVDVLRITTYIAHGVLVTAATKESYVSAPMMLRPSGTMVASS
jgi:propanol-preferring alcohol dehydrogenase